MNINQQLAQKVLHTINEEMDERLVDKTFPEHFPRWLGMLRALKPYLEGEEYQHLLDTIDVLERVAGTHALITKIFPRTN